jgi:hypothetical protein
MVTGTHADGFYAGSTAEFRVGNTTLEGLIDSFSVYTKALTQSETGDLFNSGNGVPYPDMDQVNLQNHNKLNELTGERVDFHGTDNLTDNSSVGRAIGKILD